MVQLRELKTRFGAPIAKTMLAEKRKQEEEKSSDDSNIYWMKHPDTAAEDGQ